VSHPLWDTTGDLQSLTNFEMNSDNSLAIDSQLLATLLTSEMGVEKFTKDAKSHLISHAPILSQFIFFIVVPESEVIEGVKQIENEVNTAENQLITSTVVVSGIIIIAVLVVGLWLSNSIIRPLDDLSKKAMHLVSNVTEKDFLNTLVLDTSYQDDEIGDLTKSFSRMVDSLREQSKKKSKEQI
ncbi:MAG: HAMP domain-containing protein, partial [Candidatus Kariarchaeaceae archaeon]|jgi:methyl-accepting chemotaxis protein